MSVPRFVLLFLLSIVTVVNGQPVDCTTLDGKVMAGYQGWYNTPDDGSERGFTHWARHANKPLADGNINVDVWPDLTELTPAERVKTDLRFADGRVAEVFSSAQRETVVRHFRWMHEYGIDGAFVQRFVTQLKSPRDRRNVNLVLENCRAGARENGRAYAVMYDLSGLGLHDTAFIVDDWKSLRTESHVTEDPAYLKHRGKPVVVIWGVGFNDGRKYTLDDCALLIDAFKQDGCTVMVGVPTYFRSLDRDAVPDPKLLDVIARADVVSPWTVGRYDSPEAATRYANDTLRGDVAWCRERKLDYLPVVFPGFSWHNLRDGKAPLDQIPRLGGTFFWTQFANLHHAGLRSAYVAMFDEMDEGTAIFKCGAAPLAAVSRFVKTNDVPSDHYLRLAGEGGRLLHGERTDSTQPATQPALR
ncbi:MAG: glycoside hydrolase family 71/99-like protein [Tepidisphaeraceae bacterium]